MESIRIHGNNYISSKRAAEVAGYTQDYIGQLCRAGKLPAERVSGSWYVLEKALVQEGGVVSVKDKAEEVSTTPTKELVFDGEAYISSKKAAEITGYAQDYVGQLCRSGKLVCRQVGKAWFVSKLSISREKGSEDAVATVLDKEVPLSMQQHAPLGSYTIDERPLLPVLQRRHRAQPSALYALLMDDFEPLSHKEVLVGSPIISREKHEIIVSPRRALRRRSLLSILVQQTALLLFVGFVFFGASSLSQTIEFKQSNLYSGVINEPYVDSFLSNTEIQAYPASVGSVEEGLSIVRSITTGVGNILSATLEYKAD